MKKRIEKEKGKGGNFEFGGESYGGREGGGTTKCERGHMRREENDLIFILYHNLIYSNSHHATSTVEGG